MMMSSNNNKSSRAGTSNLSRRHLLSCSHNNNNNNRMMEVQESCSPDSARATTYRSESTRHKKLVLQKDVDKLRQKLKHEESIHRALERAFNRPLGALPRLPPFLPQQTLELLAEIAVLEEEVVRLEEKVVNYRQDLYQEAVYISSKRIVDIDNNNPLESQHHDKLLNKKCKASKHQDKPSATKPGKDNSSTTTNNTVSLETFLLGKSPTPSSSDQYATEIRQECVSPSNPTRMNKQQPLSSKEINGISEETRAKENQSSKISPQQSPARKQLSGGVKTPVRKPSTNCESTNHHKDQNQESQPETVRQVVDHQHKGHKSSSKPLGNRILGGDSEPNKISEDILKLLCSIFMRLSTTEKATPRLLTLPPSIALGSRNQYTTEPELEDPYGLGTALKEWDIGAYKHLCVIDDKTMDLKKKRNALFLLHKLKLLLRKLASVNLDGLTHQHKLAFWINTYNACMMNAFLEHGIPETSEMVVVLMCEASIVVGGQLLNALTIEHFILRLPFYQKFVGPKTANNDELKARSMFGLEWSEPLVTFALSCGSWSSPAVRVYTASQVDSELEAAKRDYLGASVGICKSNNKLMIPKMLDWYLLDFAKDLESLLDWVCLQLPDELRKEALSILENKGKQEISQFVEVIPYDFSFRYLLLR